MLYMSALIFTDQLKILCGDYIDHNHLNKNV